MIIPNVIFKRDGNKDTIIDIYSRLLQLGIVFIEGEVNSNMSNLFFAQLIYIRHDLMLKEFTMYINSPGGSIYSGFAMIDMIKSSGMKCKTVCIGLAASMASFLLAAGTKGKRYSLSNARIMIHQPLQDFSGAGRMQATDISIHAKEIETLKLKGAQLYSDLSSNKNLNENDFLNMIERDKYLTPKEYIQLGLLDEIYDHEK